MVLAYRKVIQLISFTQDSTFSLYYYINVTVTFSSIYLVPDDTKGKSTDMLFICVSKYT